MFSLSINRTPTPLFLTQQIYWNQGCIHLCVPVLKCYILNTLSMSRCLSFLTVLVKLRIDTMYSQELSHKMLLFVILVALIKKVYINRCMLMSDIYYLSRKPFKYWVTQVTFVFEYTCVFKVNQTIHRHLQHQPAPANPSPSQLYHQSWEVSPSSSRSACQTQRITSQSCPGHTYQ